MNTANPITTIATKAGQRSTAADPLLTQLGITRPDVRRVVKLLSEAEDIRWQLGDALASIIPDPADKKHRAAQNRNPDSVLGRCRTLSKILWIDYGLEATPHHLYTVRLTAKAWPSKNHRRLASFTTLTVLNALDNRAEILNRLILEHGRATQALAVTAVRSLRAGNKNLPSAYQLSWVVRSDVKEEFVAAAKRAGLTSAQACEEALSDWTRRHA